MDFEVLFGGGSSAFQEGITIQVSWGLSEARVNFDMKNSLKGYLLNGLLQNELRQTV